MADYDVLSLNEASSRFEVVQSGDRYLMREPLVVSADVQANSLTLGGITITAFGDILENGTATAGTTTSLTDGFKTWVTDVFAGMTIKIVSGTGAGDIRIIASNTGSVITPTTPFSVAPDGTSVYQISKTQTADQPRGNLVVPMAGLDVTLTAGQFSSSSFEVTGTLTANVNLIIPDSSAQAFIVKNSATGAFTMTVKQAATSGVTVAQGQTVSLYTDGTTVSQATNELKGLPESLNAIGSAAAAQDVDFSAGYLHTLTLVVANTTISFINPPATGRSASMSLEIHQDATAGRLITWPASVKWAGGTAPTLTATANAVDIFTFYTSDGGTTWYGFTSGQDMQ